MSKADLIRRLSENTGRTQKECSQFYDAFFLELADTLASAEGVQFPGFGSFTVVEQGERKGFNPLIEKWMMLPPKRKVQFKPSEGLKERMNS